MEANSPTISKKHFQFGRILSQAKLYLVNFFHPLDHKTLKLYFDSITQS